MQCHECNFHARGLHFGFLIYRRAVVDDETKGTLVGRSCAKAPFKNACPSLVDSVPPSVQGARV